MADIEITNQYASKQDIYSWFETDDFPTEAQFRATWDSYWHKSESIPMASISGLVAKFNQTVSKSTFESHLKDENAHDTTLAKIDASNLLPAHIALWKQTLGVGELPPNIGTIDYVTPDGEAMIGNAYKKVEQINDGKTYLLKIDGTAVDADSFGKNIANSDLTTTGNRKLTQNHSLEFETNGNDFKISGLLDKTSDLATFKKTLAFDPVSKKIATTDLGIMSVTIPESVGNINPQSYTVTINMVMPNPAPNIPVYQQELQDFMNTLYDKNFTPIAANSWNFYTIDGTPMDLQESTSSRLRIQVNNTSVANTQNGSIIGYARMKQSLPIDKNWIFKFSFLSGVNKEKGEFGFKLGRNNDDFFSTEASEFTIRDSYGWLWVNASAISPRAQDYGLAPENEVLVIKLGNYIHLVFYFNGGNYVATFNADLTRSNYYMPMFFIQRSTQNVSLPILDVGSIKLWVQP